MLALLSLFACATADPSIPTVTEPPPTEPPVEAGPTIATKVAASPARRPPAPEVALLPGEPILDSTCFGGPPRGRRPAPRPASRPAPKPSPSSNIIRGGSDAPSGRGAMPAAEPPPSPPVEEDLRSLGYLADEAEEDREAAAADPSDEEPRRTRADAPSIDWGATVHLSNDDSMSLASAQRLLWSVSQGQTPSPAEIRPHELLNYFSFDVAPVPEGRLFSVLGAAEQRGDTLSVAFTVKGALPERRPLDLTVVVDRSGSMSAEGRMAYTKRGLQVMTEQLRPGDRVDLVLFDDRVCTPVRDFVAGRDDPALLTDAIDRMQPRGATDLDAGLREAYRIQTARTQAETHGRNRRVMVVTDALLNSGDVDEALVSEVGEQLEANDIRLTGVGVGRTFNDEMLDKLTEKGKGAYVYLGSEAVVDRVFGPGFRSLTETLAHDVRFALDLPDSLALERFYGEEASTNAADIQPIHYYAGTSQVFLQDLKVRDGRAAVADPVMLTISWRDAHTGEPDELKLRTTVGALLEGDRRNLDKARALMAWTDVALARAMRGDPCGEPLQTYLERTTRLGDDAEIAFVTGLAGKLCPAAAMVPPEPGVAYKVKVDSDVPIAEVGLACGGRAWKRSLSGSDTVARFEAARPGSCTLTLQSAVPLAAAVEVPSTGGDVRCIVRGGRLSCS